MRLALVALILSAAVGIVPGNESGCTGASQWVDCPEVENSGSQVDITAGLNRPGSTRPGGDGDAVTPPGQRATDAAPFEPEDCGPLGCRGNYEVVSFPEVTLADLVSFRPAAPTLTGEPAGFGVKGMPTNLVAGASEQHIPGTLLGWDVTVRFQPARFEFTHGDGTTALTPTGGAPWNHLRQPQFTPTPTSHIYRERGTFPVTVTVHYTAAVDFGTGTWHPVPGHITATTTGYHVQVIEAHTALVNNTCHENPTAPGC